MRDDAGGAAAAAARAVNPSRVPQQVAVVKEPQGCSILIVSPLTTTVVLMDRDEALALAAQIREAVGGLQVVDEVPLTVDDILGRGGRT